MFDFICHTLYGCVDWNTISRTASYFITVTPCMGVWIETSLCAASCAPCCVTPCMGVWIETALSSPPTRRAGCHTLYGCVDWNSSATRSSISPATSHPVWVCGLKLRKNSFSPITWQSHPVWVCGLKHVKDYNGHPMHKSHPVWVCGLKPNLLQKTYHNHRVTPCMGVWIETTENV